MDYINSSRPTAVNLSWAIKEQKEIVEKNKEKTKKEIIEALIQNAIKLENEDIEINKKIGDFGAELVPKNAGILTHCNAGAWLLSAMEQRLGLLEAHLKKIKILWFTQMKPAPASKEQELPLMNLFEIISRQH